MGRFWVKLTIALAIVAGIPCCFVLFWPIVQDRIDFRRIKLPETRDARLVGTWKGTWILMDNPEPISRVTTLRPDGTGEYRDGHDGNSRTFSWGTEKGVLYTRRMAVDAWSGSIHPYVLSHDGKTVDFERVRMFDVVSANMKRADTQQPAE